ncbi:MAG: TetR family transcriptional regulator [Saccharofermentanales bacterium]
MNNREKIMYEALTLFSENGYNAVNMRDIAQAVGIKASSLYNHFTSKEDIFETIVNEYMGRCNTYFYKMRLIGDDMQFKADDSTVNMYKNMSTEQFVTVAGQIFELIFTDEINVKLRKLLTIEQYRNEKLSKLFRELSFESSLAFQTQLFDAMIKAGCFIETDPYMMALEFFSPVFLIFYKFNNSIEGVREAKELFTRHIRHFSEVYSVKPEQSK